MIKFCPMCGKKVIAGSKFCNGCGLNFNDYQKKLDGLAASEKNAPTRAGNITTASTDPPATSARQQKDSGSDCNLQAYIRSLNEKYGALQKVYFNVEDEKSRTKIQAAQKAYASDAKKENVIFVFDDTVFGAADDGFLVTDKNIYVHNMDEAFFKISLAEINSCSIKKTLFNRRIVLNGNAEIQLTGYGQSEAEKIRDLFKDIRATFCGQAATTISAPTPAPNPKSTPPRPQTSPHPKPRYFTMETYVCDDPEAERLFQLFKAEKDFDKMIDYLEAAVNKGHIVALFCVVLQFNQATRGDDEILKSLSEEQIEAHMSNLTFTAEAGLVEAMATLGIEYDRGKFVPKDLSKAHYWYEKYLQAGLDTTYSDLVNERFQILEKFLEKQKNTRESIKESLLNNTKRVFQTVVGYNRDAIDRIEGKISLRCFYFNGSQRSQKAFDKLRAALDSYCTGLLQENEFAVACFDSTALGSADEGCLLTNRGIYIHNHGEDVKFIGYENISKNDIAVRGGNAYIGNVKIRTSVCHYNGDEHVKFFAIIWAFKNSFGR